MLKPTNHALKDLEKIKKKLENDRVNLQKRQKEKDIIEDKKQMFRSLLNERRALQLGPKAKPNLEYKCLYDFDTAKEEDKGVPYIKMLNLTKEEE